MLKKGDNKDKKPINIKLLAWLATECLAVMLFFAVCMYGAGNMLLGKVVYFAYLIIGILLLIVAVGFNGGFDSHVPYPDEIVGNLTMAEREVFVEKIRRRKAWAKKILFIDFPFLCCLLLDTIYVFLPLGGLF